jgi:putative nucleotidyltransferase with HDIG domain
MRNVIKLIKHAVKVSRYSYLIALKLKLPFTEVVKVMIAGALHDIGKFKLNFNVLFKTDELSSNEFDYIKSHVELGVEILKKLHLPKSIREMVLHHHENADGSGYPYGLGVKEVSVGARIIRVADVYSSLTVERVYRSRMSDREAIDLMLGEVDYYDFEALGTLFVIKRKRCYSSLINKKLYVTDEI